MSTLFERLVGADIESNKISLHCFRAVGAEHNRGVLTTEQVIDILSLTEPQAIDSLRIVNALATSQNPIEFKNELWDFLLLGEMNVQPEIYQDEDIFWSRFNL